MANSYLRIHVVGIRRLIEAPPLTVRHGTAVLGYFETPVDCDEETRLNTSLYSIHITPVYFTHSQLYILIT